MCFALASCNLFPISSVIVNDNTEENQLTSESDKIVLGDKIYNPFSIDNMMARGVDVSDEESNWYYFRLRQDEIDARAMEWLVDNFGLMEPVPLDRVITKSGYIYDDPEIDEEKECLWFYFMEPVEEYEKIVNSGFILEMELLDRMHVEDGILEAMLDDSSEDNLSRFVTYSSMKTLADSDPARWLFFSKNHYNKPSGKVEYYDIIEKKIKPLRNVTVEARQLLIKQRKIRTDSNGKFNINTTFSSVFLGNYVNMRVIFDNDKCSLNGYGDFGQYIIDAYYNYGSTHIDNLSNMTIRMNSSDSRTNGLANILNAVEDYHQFCFENGITKPEKLKIWINKSNSGSAMTGLFRYTGVSVAIGYGAYGLFSLIPVVGQVLGIVAGGWVANCAPDIICNFSMPLEEWNIETLYHELGHASRFFSLSDGEWRSSIWWEEYTSMGWHWIWDCWLHGKSATECCYPNNSNPVDLIESWGCFVGPYCMAWKYGKVGNLTKGNEWIAEIENSNNKDYCLLGGKCGKFHAPGLHDLIDSVNE